MLQVSFSTLKYSGGKEIIQVNSTWILKLNFQTLHFLINLIVCTLSSSQIFITLHSLREQKFVWGFLDGASCQETACQRRRPKGQEFDPWIWKIPWKRAWQPIAAFLPGESHGLRSLVDYSPQSHKELDKTEATLQEHEHENNISIRLQRNRKKKSISIRSSSINNSAIPLLCSYA